MEEKDGIVWGAPPDRAYTRTGAIAAALDQLRSRPGEWARIALKNTAGNASSCAESIRSGRSHAVRGEFETVSRRTEDGYGVFARYIPKEQA
jgi:hypothetical protein